MLVRKIEFYPSFNIQDSVANVNAYKVMAAEQHPIDVRVGLISFFLGNWAQKIPKCHINGLKSGNLLVVVWFSPFLNTFID